MTTDRTADAPLTKAGQWLIDRSEWESGLRAFRVRINATAGPEDMHRHVLAIEREAIAFVVEAARQRIEALIVEAGGRCVRPADPEDYICETHSEIMYDDSCEDQPRHLLAALAALDSAEKDR